MGSTSFFTTSTSICYRWTDISPTPTYNGTLSGTVSFSTDNGGVLEFDGVIANNNRIINSSIDLSSSNFTLMGASRYVSNTGSGGNGGRTFADYGTNWLVGHWSLGCENYYPNGASGPNYPLYVNDGYIGDAFQLNGTPSDYNWRIYAAKGTSSGPNGLSIGGYSGGENSNSRFGFVMLYNKLLSVSEMTTNYDYFKTRYGLS